MAGRSGSTVPHSILEARKNTVLDGVPGKESFWLEPDFWIPASTKEVHERVLERGTCVSGTNSRLRQEQHDAGGVQPGGSQQIIHAHELVDLVRNLTVAGADSHDWYARLV
jgi:hypothetical protein